MTDTGLLYLQTILQNDWEPAISGRINDVPQPKIVIAADEDITRLDPRQEDLLFVRNGGPVSHEPRSVGWTEKRNETLVTLDLRTTEGRARLEGTRDDNNEKERYGGLAGEAERILDKYRKGDAEYDWINGFEYRDQSEEVGYGNWRGTFEVRLTEIAEYIDPST